MRSILAISSVVLALSAHAADQRIYQTDSTGNVQYHKPSYAVEPSGRIVETDSVGNKLYQKPQYQIKDGKIYERDSFGNIQYHKPGLTIKK
jgi:hypothetical protein